MHPSTALAAGLATFFAGVAQAAYQSSVSYDASNFFSTWDFYTGADPTNGFVEYLDSSAANAAGLAGISNGAIFMGVDSTTMNPPSGRQSVRLSSQTAFTHGLFVADIAHMPGSICGAWPAFWMFGPDWPSSGEIDMIEGVNSQASDTITLHTSPGLTITNTGSDSSTSLVSADCGAGGGNSGCSQSTSNSQNYGDGFNAIGGGVYATEWTPDHVAVWFFPRSAIPADVTSGTPDPTTWGTPTARFDGDMDSYFRSNNLVFDTTFCGDWAGSPSVWAADATCSALAPTCQDYVSGNPNAFAEAYWEVNSITVYQDVDNSTAKREAAVPRAFHA